MIGFEGECIGCSPGDEPLTFVRSHRYTKPWKGGSPSVAEPTTERALRGKFLFFFSFLSMVSLLL